MHATADRPVESRRPRLGVACKPRSPSAPPSILARERTGPLCISRLRLPFFSISVQGRRDARVRVVTRRYAAADRMFELRTSSLAPIADQGDTMIPSGVSHVRRALAVIALLAGGVAAANPEPWQLNLTPGVTSISQRIYELHMLGFCVCVGIGILVFGAMFIAMFRFRKSRGAVAEQWSHSTKLEVVWTVDRRRADPDRPGLAGDHGILIDMANTNGSRHDDQGHRLSVEVALRLRRLRGKQITKVGLHVQPGSGQRIARASSARAWIRTRSWTATTRATCSTSTSRWWCRPTPRSASCHRRRCDPRVVGAAARLEAGRDPRNHQRRWTNIRPPGIYRGQCAELCGQDHGFMPIVVKAVPKAEFEQWLADAGSAEGVEQGRGAPRDSDCDQRAPRRRRLRSG